MPESNGQTTVLDRITQYFTGADGTCRQDVSKFLALVSVKECKLNPETCWTTIACKQSVSLPEYDRNLIEVDSSQVCDALTNEPSWSEYVPDSVQRMNEWTLDLYFNRDRWLYMVAAQRSQNPFVVLIEVADSARTQIAFLAYLKTISATFPANSDTDVAMIPTTWQPTGAPYEDAGVGVCYQ